MLMSFSASVWSKRSPSARPSSCGTRRNVDDRQRPPQHADLQVSLHNIYYRAELWTRSREGRWAQFAGACRELDAAGVTALVASMAPGRSRIRKVWCGNSMHTPVHGLNAECIATAIDRIRVLRFHDDIASTCRVKR